MDLGLQAAFYEVLEEKLGREATGIEYFAFPPYMLLSDKPTRSYESERLDQVG
jgi:hypothetical protein